MMIVFLILSFVSIIVATACITISAFYYNGKLLMNPKTQTIVHAVGVIFCFASGNFISQLIKLMVS